VAVVAGYSTESLDVAKIATRNVLVVAAGVVIYWVVIRYLSTALDWVGATNGRLQIGIIVHYQRKTRER
jgi:hypothetical protein